MVSCITNKSATKPPRVLEAAAEVLRPRGVRVARVHCWHPIETKKGKRTLAQRFGFREKPPVVMATNGKAPPTFLAATGLNAEALAAKVLAAVIPDAELPKASIRDGKCLAWNDSGPWADFRLYVRTGVRMSLDVFCVSHHAPSQSVPPLAEAKYFQASRSCWQAARKNGGHGAPQLIRH